jgi:ABC-type proline/glycine betaine transport system permease subunit
MGESTPLVTMLSCRCIFISVRYFYSLSVISSLSSSLVFYVCTALVFVYQSSYYSEIFSTICLSFRPPSSTCLYPLTFFNITTWSSPWLDYTCVCLLDLIQHSFRHFVSLLNCFIAHYYNIEGLFIL